jgi:hypothetical protein
MLENQKTRNRDRKPENKTRKQNQKTKRNQKQRNILAKEVGRLE